MKADVHGSNAPAGEPQSARVDELADLLIHCYGPQALRRAQQIERQSLFVELAGAVTRAVETKLGATRQ